MVLRKLCFDPDEKNYKLCTNVPLKFFNDAPHIMYTSMQRIGDSNTEWDSERSLYD
jgi:hypothetical protein